MGISVVIPVYNAEHVLDELCLRLKTVLLAIGEPFELIVVDDRSPDLSWPKMLLLAQQFEWIKPIRLSRNFGQHAAITAGLMHAELEYVVVMDCDLQDQPEEIRALFAKILGGADIVLARRMSRQDPIATKLGSYFFYKTLAYLTDTKQDSFVANFGIYKQKVIRSVLAMKDAKRYFPTMVRWVGFETAYVDVQHAARLEGVSNYSFRKRLSLSLDVILAFSDKPLRLVAKAGLLMCAFSCVLAGAVVLLHLLGKLVILGWASTILVICFFSGVNILILGFVGLYVGRIYDQVKGRPLYIIDQYKSEQTER